MSKARFNPSPPKSVLTEVDDDSKPSAWIRASVRALVPTNSAAIVLLGGADLIGFRLRQAQSQMRADALPGFFSHAALVLTGSKVADLELWHAPLAVGEFASVPARNGIAPLPLETLDERGFYPNLAVLYVPVDDVTALRSAARNLQGARLSEDLITPIPAWLAYAWQCTGSSNPLQAGFGIPSAMFVEACYSAARLDLVPGTSQRIVTPEAIWQAAKWWSSSVGKKPLKGRYRVRQSEAAASFKSAMPVAKFPRDIP